MPRARTKEGSKLILNSIIHEAKEEIVPIKSIDMWDKNPYKYDKKVITNLAEGITVHGQITAVVVYTEDNMIRKGNKTYLAMKQAGSKYIRAKFVHFKSLVVANTYALFDNLSSTWSRWDDDMINLLFKSKEFRGIDTEKIGMLTGFNPKELALFNTDDFTATDFTNEKESFERTKGALEKTKKFWFWFEVEDEETYNRIKELYYRGKGKRLHRELDSDKVCPVLL